MHAVANFFIVVVLATSVTQVFNPTIVEARNLNSSLSFKVDLIRRNSALFPNHDSSMPLGSISYGHNIRLSSKYFDQKDVSTYVTPNGGEHFIKFSIGTPPIEYTGVADTGSDLIWVQCSPCSHCLQQESPLFKPSKSSSYHAIPCNSQSCDLQVGFNHTACSRNYFSNNKPACAYTAIYGSGESIGILSTDTISFPLADASQAGFPSSFILGCGYYQQGQLGKGSHGVGIVGLGRGTLSLVSQLGPRFNYKFSYCLTPLSSNMAGKIQFGSGVAKPRAFSTPFTTYSPTFYTLTLNGISIGNSYIAAGLNIIIDSGTTFTYIPTKIYESVQAAMVNAIGFRPVAGPNNVYRTCYEIQPSGQGFNPPDAVFHFQGADVVLKAVNTFREVSDNLSCLAIVPTDDLFIFGNIAQINYEVGYDLNAKQISFAPTDCTKY